MWAHTSTIVNTFLLASSGPILYVEDDEDDQHLMKTALRDLQIPNELRLFDSGQAALDFLITTLNDPFLIISDVNLPQMNGIELRRYINKDEFLKKKSIPFIYLTTASYPNVVLSAFDETVQGFFRKADNYLSFKNQVRLIVSYWQAGL
ncbi:response regulator, partial [Nostoc sp. CHAB 5834]|nr:response regulator [Nostoc sp. CHAB 5834]